MDIGMRRNIFMYICIYMFMYIYLHIYIHIYVYMYINIHVYFHRVWVRVVVREGIKSSACPWIAGEAAAWVLRQALRGRGRGIRIRIRIGLIKGGTYSPRWPVPPLHRCLCPYSPP
jgi:hypothetical protein